MRGYYSIGRKSYSTGLYMGNGAKLGPIFTGTRDHNLFYNLKTGAETDCNKGYPREICADPEFVGELHDSVWQTSNDQTLWDHADLRLSSKSPALYSGTTIPAITEDFAGTPRPQFSTYDIGAFEFTGSNPPIIQTGFLPDATAGSAYRTTLEATGDTPISWSIAAGALPAWATLDPSTGVITGRPNAAGKTAFTVRARSHAGAVEAPFTLTISAMPPRQPAARR